jgi:hypothetical protein
MLFSYSVSSDMKLQLFPGRDLGEVTFALGLHISHNWDDDTIAISID